MGKFDAGAFRKSMVIGTLIALLIGAFIVYKSSDSESRHYAPLAGALLGYIVGNGVGDTDIWYSPDWFPPINEHLRRIVMILFVTLGALLGVLVEAVWGIGVR